VSREPASIRGYQSGDLDTLYRICLQTADHGGDATRLFSDPSLPGNIWVAPYAILEPEHAFVAEDAGGVGGYVVGALDTSAFEQRQEREWWPHLRARYPELSPEASERLTESERFAIGDIHRPWLCRPDLAARFPSHLHIDLLPRLQGRGLGRRLMATLVSSLRDHGSRGLHLFVARGNERAVGFYRHLGFTQVPADDALIFGLDFGDLPAALR
jgi:ribosomal protein S18 acetylase RimI-like enzyme